MVDVDGVVIRTRPGGWAADLETDLGLPADLLQSHFFGPHWDDVVMGRAALRDRLDPFLARHAPHLSSSELTGYWFAKDAWLDDDLLADLAAVRAGGLTLHLATVQEHERAGHIWDTLRFRDRFDAMHYAADLGCGKPDPEFFARIEARTGFVPADLLLLDDRPANVEAARAAGWRGALWDGKQVLSEVLAAQGVRV